MANITLVLLANNDTDPEMPQMRECIQANLESHEHAVAMLDGLDFKQFPALQEEAWLCGHCRFVEANTQLRKFAARNLGGFPLPLVAAFLNNCIQFKGVHTIRMILCESAQQNQHTRQPQAGAALPAPLDKDLGTTTAMPLTTQIFNAWPTLAAANVSHLEQLLVYMKMAWDSSKPKAPFPAFEIVGLWGAGDVMKAKPITSFLQIPNGLQTEKAARENQNDKTKQDAFAAIHCAPKNLPDFFGYQVPADFFRAQGIASIPSDPFKDQ